MFKNIYENRRVFITGHTGFKGSWLSLWLLSLGANVAGYSDGVPTAPSNFGALKLQNKIVDTCGDVRDAVSLTKAMRAFAPDIVFHLAAQALVQASYDDPAGTIETNAMGTLQVLEAVRKTPSVQAVVCITSDKCYHNDEWVYGYRETDSLGGEDPYSASKSCAEIIAHSYFKSFFKDGPACATVRAGNVIGGGDWADNRIVPDCARAFAVGSPVNIRSPWSTRPWQHVLEPLSGYLWLGACLLGGSPSPFSLSHEAYNFGPPAETNATVIEVVEALKKHWPGFSCDVNPDSVMGRKECTLLKLCCDKALAHLGWRATLNFEETIRYTAEWYSAYYGYGDQAPSDDMLAFGIGQIRAYANTAELRGQAWTK